MLAFACSTEGIGSHYESTLMSSEKWHMFFPQEFSSFALASYLLNIYFKDRPSYMHTNCHCIAILIETKDSVLLWDDIYVNIFIMCLMTPSHIS